MTIRPVLFLAAALANPLAVVASAGPFGAEPPVVRAGPPQLPSDPDRWLPWRVFTWRDGVKPGAPALAQDSQGYIWAGTPEGLVRYNGQSWQRVEVPGKPAPVFAITGRRDGSLWIGRPPESQIYRLKNGVWTQLDPRAGVPPGVIEAMIETVERERSTLWIATSLGLARCLDDVCTEVKAVRGYTVRTLLPTRSADGRLALWIGTSRGLLRLEHAGAEHPSLSPLFDDASALPGISIRSLAETTSRDGRRSLWVGTELGVARLRDGLWTRYDRGSGFPAAPILKLVACQGPDGKPVVWAGSFGAGLFRFTDDGRWQLFDIRSGLPANYVLNLLATGPTGEETLWVTTPASLARLDRERWHATDTRSGLPNDLVMGLGEVTFPDRLHTYWIGTVNGMVRLTPRGWERYSTLPGISEVVLNAVNAREADGSSSLWLGTLDGLLHFSQGRWSSANSEGHPLPHAWILSLLAVPGPHGSEVWSGTQQGLARYAAGRWTLFDRSNSGLPGREVRALVRSTPDGAPPVLWAGTENGVARLQGGAWQPAGVPCLPDPVVLSLQTLSNAQGRWLWIVTRGGIARMRLDPADRLQEPCEAMTDRTRPALNRGATAPVQADVYGRIYVFTESGVDRLTLDPATGLAGAWVETFDTGDGLPGMEFTDASFRDHLGRIWGGATGGAAILDPAPPRQAPAQGAGPPLLLEHVKVAGQERALRSGTVLRHDESSLELQFALLSYRREHATLYRTQLAGLEDDPTPWSPENRVIYNRLPQGDYTFRVWGRDGEGRVSGPIAVSFRVRPAPWLTSWAIALYALTLIGLGWGFSLLRVKALARRAVLLEHQVAERTRELAEANRKLELASLTDPLTGLSNRRFLDVNIGSDLGQAVRNAQSLLELTDRNSDLIFYFIDLDYFKRLNDWAGHPAGDAVLVEIGRRLREVARTTDAVVRWGGEEFLIVSRWANRQAGAVLASRTLEVIAGEPFLVDGQRITLTCSVGWAPYPWSVVDPERFPFEEVLGLADRALYLAKREGRNRAVGVLPGPESLGGEPAPDGNLEALEGRAVSLVRHQGPDVVPSFAPTSLDSGSRRTATRT
jgi:diguanylate cyclase (GGDEF)-like protein